MPAFFSTVRCRNSRLCRICIKILWSSRTAVNIVVHCRRCCPVLSLLLRWFHSSNRVLHPETASGGGGHWESYEAMLLLRVLCCWMDAGDVRQSCRPSNPPFVQTGQQTNPLTALFLLFVALGCCLLEAAALLRVLLSSNAFALSVGSRGRARRAKDEKN